MVGWLLFGSKELDRQEKWRDAIQRNEISREHEKRKHVTLSPPRPSFPGPPQPPLTQAL